MYKIILFIFIIAWQSQATENPNDHSEHHLSKGGRKGLHGMVLFGAGRYFLEHIPMLTPPHDFQIISEVQLRDNSQRLIDKDFSKSAFTFKPTENFSLNDYISGRLRKFSGAIHEGSFEQGGPVILGLENISAEVVEYKLIRQLPANSEKSIFELSDGSSIFQSNIIRPQENTQIIVNKTSGTNLWCVTGPDFFNPCQKITVPQRQ